MGVAGEQVGGLGQTIEFTVDTSRPWQLNAVTSRLTEAPQGIFGGAAGAAGSFTVNGEPVRTQARVTLQPGDRVRLDLPGGGGYGEPRPWRASTDVTSWPAHQRGRSAGSARDAAAEHAAKGEQA